MKITPTSAFPLGFEFSQPNPRLGSESFELSLAGGLGGLIGALPRLLLTGAEPKIWQTQGSDQTQVWHVYDPQTAETLSFDSEMALRAWLEDRYNH
ncbi:MAG: hypothetical protein HC825_05110 [Oscillatoriales cyanobacterium RM1_1_9]|nr:hypothetical protein [Oscillatoriales cyanobacterium RM2_1_1]NJO71235.1 hypothetical protein [Oscillatoriales cyanobacterium RM1_1_9]